MLFRPLKKCTKRYVVLALTVPISIFSNVNVLARAIIVKALVATINCKSK